MDIREQFEGILSDTSNAIQRELSELRDVVVTLELEWRNMYKPEVSDKLELVRHHASMASSFVSSYIYYSNLLNSDPE